MIAEKFQNQNIIVSRETISKFEIYESLLRKWQKTINLVGPSTLNDITDRHFLDSARLMAYIPDANSTLIDMGSGAGFPGMVLAMMGIKNVHLIESDTRKTVFLQTVSRETNTPVTIHNRRVADCDIPDVDIVTARALAPLKELMDMMSKFVHRRGVYGLFLKGARAEDEIAEARKAWDFSAEVHTGASTIIKVSNLISKRCGT